MLKVGQRAPEFTLPDHTGVDRNLTDFLHRGALILYFYPADFTPGCTKEACELRDLQSDITNVGLQVVGISPQSSQSHSRFRDKYSLPFVLLSDEEKTVVKMYDVNGPLGFGVRRATYLLSQDRMIQGAVLADIAIGRHKAFVEKAIKLRQAESGKTA
jgi:peroxiredoxin Q/BCP